MERYSWKRNPKRIFEQNITLQSVTQNSNSDFWVALNTLDFSKQIWVHICVKDCILFPLLKVNKIAIVLKKLPHFHISHSEKSIIMKVHLVGSNVILGHWNSGQWVVESSALGWWCSQCSYRCNSFPATARVFSLKQRRQTLQQLKYGKLRSWNWLFIICRDINDNHAISHSKWLYKYLYATPQELKMLSHVTPYKLKSHYECWYCCS